MSILETLGLSGISAGNLQAGPGAHRKVPLDGDNIPKLKDVAEDRGNSAAGDALDALVQLIAHEKADVRQSALSAVRSLPNTLVGQVNDRLSALFGIAKKTTTLLNPEAVAFTAYHVAKQESYLGHDGHLYRDALGAWADAIKNSSDAAMILSPQLHGSLIPDSEIKKFAESKPEEKANRIRELLDCEGLLANNRYVTTGELNSYAFQNKERDNSGHRLRYCGAFSHQKGLGLDSLSGNLKKYLGLERKDGRAICSILIGGHYVHVARLNNEICILDSLGKSQPPNRVKALEEIMAVLTDGGYEVSSVYEDIQSDGFPNGCAIFGPALENLLHGEKGLENRVKKFVDGVKEMDPISQRDMNDRIRGNCLIAAMIAEAGKADKYSTP